MNFVSLEFLLFLGAVWSLYWWLGGFRARKWLLTGASYVFYAAWDWRFCGLMLFVTANAFLAGRMIGKPVTRKGRVLAASIALDLVVLGFFKYWDFFLGNAVAAFRATGLDLPAPALKVVLPIGISFYTFHAMSYVIDVYRGKVAAARSPLDVALYIAFFPQLIAGPIVRASHFMPQLRRRPPFERAMQANGVRLFVCGLIYKAALADTLGQLCGPVFQNVSHYSNQALLTATIAFYGQIYFDFAGYSLMAIGTARLFGYRIPQNFNYPYAAASVTEFWRRWHVSLSSWLRDYVYISLGGNRGGWFAFYRNLMITMLLGGLWHGAAWTFVAWGLLHGIGLCIHKVWLGVRGRLRIGIDWDGLAWRVVAVAITQLWVLVAWIFFRCDSFADAVTVMKALTGLRHSTGDNITDAGIWVLMVIAADHALGLMKHRPSVRSPALRRSSGSVSARLSHWRSPCCHWRSNRLSISSSSCVTMDLRAFPT